MKLILFRYNRVPFMPDFDLPAHHGCSYGREELLQLRRADVTLPRAVRKAIFSHGLWLPRHQRNPSNTENVNNS